MTAPVAIERVDGGKFAPGVSGNPGGRPRLPVKFTEKGPARLAKMDAIAEDESHEHYFDALKWCLEKQYGKPSIFDDTEEGADATGYIQRLVAAVAGVKPQAAIIDAEFTETKEST